MTTDVSDASDAHGILRLPLGTQVARAIRRDIILGRLAPGTVLVQERLCEIYDVSRVPIRDALLTLLSEGFVERNRRNQMVTAEWSPDDLLDTFRIEALLCGLAARLAVQNATDAELEEMDALLRRGEDAGDPPDRSITAAVTWQFHRSVNRAARSRRLIAALRAVSVHFVQDFMKEVPGWWCHSREQHREIFEAIRARDAELAERLMRHHFEEAGQHVARFLVDHRASQQDGAPGDEAPLRDRVPAAAL